MNEKPNEIIAQITKSNKKLFQLPDYVRRDQEKSVNGSGYIILLIRVSEKFLTSNGYVY